MAVIYRLLANAVLGQVPVCSALRSRSHIANFEAITILWYDNVIGLICFLQSGGQRTLAGRLVLETMDIWDVAVAMV